MKTHTAGCILTALLFLAIIVESASPSPSSSPTAEETARMNRAMKTPRAKLDNAVTTFGMSSDFVIADRAYVTDGRVTVNLDIDLVSQDAKSAFASRKLQNNTYPGFKRHLRRCDARGGFFVSVGLCQH